MARSSPQGGDQVQVAGRDRTSRRIHFGVKDRCRETSARTEASMARVKRLAKYLAEFARLVWDFSRDAKGDDGVLQVFADGGWAVCPRPRPLTSGGLVV